MRHNMKFQSGVPSVVMEYYSSISNNVRALYALISMPLTFGLIRKWWHIEAGGQLCFDEAAANAVAHNMYNRLPNHGKGWRFHAWKCEMDGPLTDGAELHGIAPVDFDIYDYVSSKEYPFGKRYRHIRNYE